MTTNSNEKRVNTLENKQSSDKEFIPARWLTLAEAEAEADIWYAAEEAANTNIEEKEARDRAAGCPEWTILVERENRARYYRRKAKQEAEAQQAREARTEAHK